MVRLFIDKCILFTMIQVNFRYSDLRCFLFFLFQEREKMDHQNKQQSSINKSSTGKKKQWQTPELFIEETEDITEGGNAGSVRGETNTYRPS